MNRMVRTYSKTKDGDQQLSVNFTVSEFACRDGSDKILISDELIIVLQKIRDHYKVPILINSGYRSPAYNKRINGAADSQHMKGTAADINVKGVKPAQLHKDLDSGKVLGKSHTGGLGLYKTFVHIDVRPNKARWNG